MSSSSLQVHTFSLHFWSFIFVSLAAFPLSSSPLISALLPTTCPSVCHGWGCPTLLPLPRFIWGAQFPCCLPSVSPASSAISSLPSLCPRNGARHRARITTKQDSCRDTESCLLWSIRVFDLLERRPKATHRFVAFNNMVLLVYLSSTHPSSLLQTSHTVFPEWVTETWVLFEEWCLLLKSCCSEVCAWVGCTCLCESL